MGQRGGVAVPVLLTTEEVAKILRVTPDTVRRKAVLYAHSDGRKGLRGFKDSERGPWRFKTQDVDSFISVGVTQ